MTPMLSSPLSLIMTRRPSAWGTPSSLPADRNERKSDSPTDTPRPTRKSLVAEFQSLPGDPALRDRKASLPASPGTVAAEPAKPAKPAKGHGLMTVDALQSTLLASGRRASVMRPDVVLFGQTIKKNSTHLKAIFDLLAAYLQVAPEKVDQLKSATVALLNALDKYRGRYAQQMADFQKQVDAEVRTIADVADIIRGQHDDDRLDAGDVLNLRRAGMPVDLIAEGIEHGLDAEAIVLIAPFWHAKVPPGALTADTPYVQRAVVPGSRFRLGQGAINTVWSVDYRVGARTQSMVFKPEQPGVDIGAAAEAAGIDPDAPNLCGRSRAVYLCSKALGLALVPTTVVTVLDGQVGSLMAFVDGYQPVSEGRALIELRDDQARALEAQPDIMRAYARECGCTGAVLQDHALRLERRTLTAMTDDEGEPLRDETGLPRMQLKDGLIRVALPLHDGRFRRQLVQAQWLDGLVRQVDRGPMNLRIALDASGQPAIRLIDNDAAFGSRLSASDEIGPADAASGRRAHLPAYIDRPLFKAINQLDALELATQVGEILDSRAASVQLVRDILYLRTRLATYEAEGRILDTDVQWEAAEVSKALGIDHDGSQFHRAIHARSRQGHQSIDFSRQQVKTLQEALRAKSYCAREALDTQELHWTRSTVTDAERPRLVALFDPAELFRRVAAAHMRE